GCLDPRPRGRGRGRRCRRSRSRLGHGVTRLGDRRGLPRPFRLRTGYDPAMPIDLGIALPHYDFSFPEPPAPRAVTVRRVVAAGLRAEALGFHEAWVSDHLWLDLGRYGGPPGKYGTTECLITLAALAQRTSSIRLGSLVLANGLRPPTVLAKTLATLDQLAGG